MNSIEQKTGEEEGDKEKEEKEKEERQTDKIERESARERRKRWSELGVLVNNCNGETTTR